MIKCAHCGETRASWDIWRQFHSVPDGDVVCCLMMGMVYGPLEVS